MGSRLGPNYACFFMGHIEEQIFEQYTGTVPALYQINDTLTTLSELPPAVKVKNRRFRYLCEWFSSKPEIHLVHL